MRNFRIWSVLLLVLCSTRGIAQEPMFRMRDLDNQWVEYSQLKGKELTVLDFWATWCQPCVRSLPLLNEIYEGYSDRGVSFIGVSVDGPRNQAKVKPFIESLGISYPIIRDLDSELMSDLGVTAVPTMIIYNREGEMLFFHEGFLPGDEAVLKDLLEQQLQ
mgnify:CR=1 FL=1